MINKEIILEKSRKEGKDEGKEFLEHKGRTHGFVFFCILYLFIAAFNLFKGDSTSTFSAITSLFFCFMSSEAFIKYRYTKEKAYLITFVASLLTVIFSLLNYILVCLR